jgi:RimJ/RimL family protein N-acetyltransferase
MSKIVSKQHIKPNLIFKYLSDADGSTEMVWKLIADNYPCFGYVCPKTLEEVKNWVRDNEVNPTFVVYKKLTQDDTKPEFAGFIYVSNYANFRAEIGYMVCENYRKNGIGTAMIKYAENYIKDFMNVKCVNACVYNSKESSRLLLKSGYEDCGTVQNWCKVFVDDKSQVLNKTTYSKTMN